MNKLFILSGASGAGKSTLMDRLVKSGDCNAVIKYSERFSYSTVDDICTVKDINNPELQCDMVYTMYGNKYGFNSKMISKQLHEGNLMLITNDKLTIAKLKEDFPQQVVTIFIVSDINKRLLRNIYINRHGFPSIKNIENSLNDQLNFAQKMILQDDGEKFIQCMETIYDLVDNIILQEEEFRLRLYSVNHQDELYSSGLFIYDYTVLNLYTNEVTAIHATNSAFEQLKKIIYKETEK